MTIHHSLTEKKNNLIKNRKETKRQIITHKHESGRRKRIRNKKGHKEKERGKARRNKEQHKTYEKLPIIIRTKKFIISSTTS